ncbi:TrkA family protein [Dokdonia sp. Hel_I_63]|jgi:di/tricarboxylate transporter|uniref:SLC13 family permease n=1 Tax=unclassified Dokdonia TaxID=2615033 RepID=UPI00020A6844|nr:MULTISPECIES: SLC13 family permease [unclassified Dokdonia]AEE19532.1 Citrate transporter [Dokdonia sp. 4H-3-7-5]TVZ21240.1 TrkA family protein [Dokdonia sp. Hel_I_63]
MELPILLVFLIIGATIILFVTEFFPIDKIALFVVVSLLLLGLTTPEEAISGFSNAATITILSLMILAVGLEENGVIQWLTDGIRKLKLLPLILITPAFMIVSAGISAFISTTAVVIIFIKIVSQLAEKYNFSSSKLLMPISFAGILGGSCTLMGTSTNLIVNSLAKEAGAESLGFFEFSFIGLAFVLVGVIFMTIASRFLPKDKSKDLQGDYGIDKYVFSIKVKPEASFIGKKIADIDFLTNQNGHILKLIRDRQVINAPGKYVTIQEDDELILLSEISEITDLSATNEISFNEKQEENNAKIDNEEQQQSENKKLTYVELLILPGSEMIGKTIKNLRNMSLQGAFPIAINKRKNIRNTQERLLRKNVDNIRVKPGDRLLVETQTTAISRLNSIQNIAILNEHDYKIGKTTLQKSIALIILLGVIGLAASGVLSILGASLTGVAAMLLTNSISLENVYHKINWQIIFLLAGMIPLGVAMTNTGADTWLSENLLTLLDGQTPTVVIALLFGFTMLISGTISNNATAIIMTPIALSLAAGLSLPVKPFILAVMFAANFSFFTPVGYQTNTLIYGTGIYKFKHFLIIGGMLSIILWILATFILSTML